MRNLTLASAKHLLNMGHITPAHHAKIVAASTMPKMATMPKPPKAAFGALAAPPPGLQPGVQGMPQPGAAPQIPGLNSSILTPPGLPGQ
jgi:hypothetical protein